MNDKYIKYLRGLDKSEINELLDLYFEDQITLSEFELEINELARKSDVINEKNFLKSEKIDKMLRGK